MKRLKRVKRRSAVKTVGKPKTVEQYLARIAEPAKSTLQQVRAAIRSAVPPEATEVISYGIPAVRYKGILVWYAAFANHCSLFPTAAVIAAFREELNGFRITKGTIQFSVDKALPRGLVRRMMKLRLAQVAGKPRS